jgi:hypothetical protein
VWRVAIFLYWFWIVISQLIQIFYFLLCYFSLIDWCYLSEAIRENNVSKILKLNEWSINTDILFSPLFKTLILPPVKGWKDMYYLNWCKVTGRGTLPAWGGGGEAVLWDEVRTPIYIVIYHFCFIGVTRDNETGQCEAYSKTESQVTII